MESNAERLMTVEEAAAYLGWAVGTLYNKVQAAEVPHKKLGRSVRFRRSELDAWVEQQAVPARVESA